MKRKSTLYSTLWSMVERFSKTGIQVLCTFLIAQIVPPSEFGLVSMMSIFLAFSTILIDSGFGQALIHEQKVTEEDKSSIFWFNVLLGISVYFLFFICAPFIADFYHEEKLTALIRVAFLALIFQSFIVVPQALFFKSISFKVVSKVSLGSMILSGGIGIAVSLLRKDAWGLVLQNLSFAVFQSLLFWFYSSWRPTTTFIWSSVKKYLRFSLHLLGSNSLAAITDNLANLIVGKYYNATILGHYTIANKIPYLTAGTISYSIHRVSYSVMSTFQDDNKKLSVYSQHIVGTAFWLIGSIMVILFVGSDFFVQMLLPAGWEPVATYLRYFSVIGFVYPFYDINQDILLIKGRTDWLFRLDIIRRTLLVATILLGIQFNIVIFLRLLTLYYILNAVTVSYLAGRLISCNILQQLWLVLTTPVFFLQHMQRKSNENH